jgi:hypothetical protein
MIRKALIATIAILTAFGAWVADPAAIIDAPSAPSFGVATAQAQEIQITGPLAGAPAVRRLRLHREGKFDVAAHGTFTLLDEFKRGIMPGLRLNYHFFDWFAVGVFGGPVFTYQTGLSSELQEKAIDNRNCEANPNSLACKRTATSLCRGEDCLKQNQLGAMVWYIAPQLTLIPFRGKFSLFGSAFLDSDISIFLGAGIAGINERSTCGNSDGDFDTCSDPDSFSLKHRVTAGPTFGLGFNFYPVWTNSEGGTESFIGFGAEFRATPIAWNTSGFDKAGEDDDFPDDVIDGNDRALKFNPMLTAYISFQLPPGLEVSD